MSERTCSVCGMVVRNMNIHMKLNHKKKRVKSSTGSGFGFTLKPSELDKMTGSVEQKESPDIIPRISKPGEKGINQRTVLEKTDKSGNWETVPKMMVDKQLGSTVKGKDCENSSQRIKRNVSMLSELLDQETAKRMRGLDDTSECDIKESASKESFESKLEMLGIENQSNQKELDSTRYKECPDCKTVFEWDKSGHRFSNREYFDHVENCGLDVGLGFGVTMVVKQTITVKSEPEDIAIKQETNTEEIKAENNNHDSIEVKTEVIDSDNTHEKHIKDEPEELSSYHSLVPPSSNCEQEKENGEHSCIFCPTEVALENNVKEIKCESEESAVDPTIIKNPSESPEKENYKVDNLNNIFQNITHEENHEAYMKSEVDTAELNNQNKEEAKEEVDHSSLICREVLPKSPASDDLEPSSGSIELSSGSTELSSGHHNKSGPLDEHFIVNSQNSLPPQVNSEPVHIIDLSKEEDTVPTIPSGVGEYDIIDLSKEAGIIHNLSTGIEDDDIIDLSKEETSIPNCPNRESFKEDVDNFFYISQLGDAWFRNISAPEKERKKMS